MTTSPKISVVIPTYNRASYLRLALTSLELQTLAPDAFEVIVVDDGSSDGTEALCRTWDGGLSLRYYRQSHAGSAAAKNLGLFLSNAEVVLFFDDDDAASESFLEEHRKGHDAFPEARTSILSFTTWDPDLEVTPVMDYLVNVGQFLFSYVSLCDRQQLGWQHFWTGRISCKRSFLTHFGIFSPRMKRVEDIELGYRLARHGHEVRYWPAATSYMLRPITFHDFCRRAENDGRALAELKRVHPTPEVLAYCKRDEASGPELLMNLDAIAAAVEALEALGARGVGCEQGGPLLSALYELYRLAFLGFGLKGASEGEGDSHHDVGTRSTARRYANGSCTS